MEPSELVHRIEETFKDAVVSAADEGAFTYVQIQPESLKSIMSFCVHDEAMRFDFLESLTAADTGQEIVVIYQLHSMSCSHRLNVKVQLPRHSAVLPSMTAFWRAAGVYELEAAEMLGITFEGHPQPRKLLLTDDWHGHPLRKDYVFPEEYHDVEHRRQPLRKEHARP